jgi:hypothetical protein
VEVARSEHRDADRDHRFHHRLEALLEGGDARLLRGAARREIALAGHDSRPPHSHAAFSTFLRVFAMRN